jgi:hypothetical protein
LVIPEDDGIPGCIFMDDEVGDSFIVQSYGYGACGKFRMHTDEVGLDAIPMSMFQGFVPQVILPNRGDESRFDPHPGKMGGEIERGASDIGIAVNDIPEYLAE